MEQHLRDHGFGFGRFDFRGHGTADGTIAQITLTRLLDDLRLALETTREALPDTPIVLVGSSLGGFVSAWYNALETTTADAQVLIAPAFRIAERYFAALSARDFARWRKNGTRRFQGDGIEFDLDWDVVEDAARYPHHQLVDGTHVSTWILHGTEDLSVPIDLSREFVDTCNGVNPEFVEIPGADHRLTGCEDSIVDMVLHVARSVHAKTLAPEEA